MLKNNLTFQKAFGQFSSCVTQRPTTLQPVEIELDTQEDTYGGEHHISFDKGQITINNTGMYLIIAGPQIAKESGNISRWVDVWLRVNNVDVPNSNIRRTIKDPDVKDVAILQVLTKLNKGDTLNIMMCVEELNEGLGIECIEPSGAPVIPSMILTILQLD
ncbi:hypothetical protein Nisw_01275 [Candidatus Nitrosopumilus sp. SW]|uniref:hypothetical protein n=1 Tax=Candidatus Nitrosopumilus sp. SW TaxID=2508726 RepID=UPI00114D711B|nr:hypothetical protein [Candidatus Nitrosopumilus sp. SW]QDI88257.1 hypothetical protein Nisw_01275 [Candidatus Nitrosopumilus sp. SW]